MNLEESSISIHVEGANPVSNDANQVKEDLGEVPDVFDVPLGDSEEELPVDKKEEQQKIANEQTLELSQATELSESENRQRDNSLFSETVRLTELQ